MGFFTELRRRHVIRVAGAYLLLAWVVLQVTDVVISLLELPSGTGRLVFYVLVIGFPLAILASWIFEITPEGIKRESEVDHTTIRATSTGRAIDFVIIAALTVVVGFLVWERIQPEDQYRSIAVLPVRAIGGDDTGVLFANGMHDTLLVELATAVNLAVIARRSVMEFADSDKSIAEIAAVLGVTYIVEASVQKFGDQLRVSAQLIGTKSGKHLWGDTYDEAIGFDNFFEVQSEIADKIGLSLKTKLLPVRGFGSQNEEAVRDYLGAMKTFIEQCALCGDVEPLLESAVEKDPEFALAWVRLADVYQQKYWFSFDEYGVSARDQAEAAMARARALQPDLPELHLVQAKIRYHGYLDFEGALAELELAEEALPGLAEVFAWRGFTYRRMGDWPNVLVAFRRAMELDPRGMGNLYGGALLMLRRYKEAEAYFEQAVSDFPDLVRFRIALADVDWYRNADVSGYFTALEGSNSLDRSDLMELIIHGAWIDGQFDLALEYIEKLEKIEFGALDRLLRLQKAFILRDAGRDQEARALFEQEAAAIVDELASDPDALMPLIHAAHLYVPLGEKELAADYVRRAMNVARGNKDPEVEGGGPPVDGMPLMYGHALCQLGDHDAAADAFRLFLKEDNPYTLDSAIGEWPPCRDQFVSTPQYEALLKEFGHLTEG